MTFALLPVSPARPAGQCSAGAVLAHATWAAARTVAGALANARTVVLEGHEHVAHDPDPDAFASLLVRFARAVS